MDAPPPSDNQAAAGGRSAPSHLHHQPSTPSSPPSDSALLLMFPTLTRATSQSLVDLADIAERSLESKSGTTTALSHLSSFNASGSPSSSMMSPRSTGGPARQQLASSSPLLGLRSSSGLSRLGTGTPRPLTSALPAASPPSSSGQPHMYPALQWPSVVPHHSGNASPSISAINTAAMTTSKSSQTTTGWVPSPFSAPIRRHPSTSASIAETLDDAEADARILLGLAGGAKGEEDKKRKRAPRLRKSSATTGHSNPGDPGSPLTTAATTAAAAATVVDKAELGKRARAKASGAVRSTTTTTAAGAARDGDRMPPSSSSIISSSSLRSLQQQDTSAATHHHPHLVHPQSQRQQQQPVVVVPDQPEIISVVKRKGTVIVLKWGSPPLAVERTIRGTAFIPDGFEVETISDRKTWIGQTRVVVPGLSEASLQYRFYLKSDPTKCGSWHKNASKAYRDAFAKLDNVNPDQLEHLKSSNGRLIIGVTYGNLQERIRTIFSAEVAELERQLLLQGPISSSSGPDDAILVVGSSTTSRKPSQTGKRSSSSSVATSSKIAAGNDDESSGNEDEDDQKHQERRESSSASRTAMSAPPPPPPIGTPHGTTSSGTSQGTTSFQSLPIPPPPPPSSSSVALSNLPAMISTSQLHTTTSSLPLTTNDATTTDDTSATRQQQIVGGSGDTGAPDWDDALLSLRQPASLSRVGDDVLQWTDFAPLYDPSWLKVLFAMQSAIVIPRLGSSSSIMILERKLMDKKFILAMGACLSWGVKDLLGAPMRARLRWVYDFFAGDEAWLDQMEKSISSRAVTSLQH